MGCDSTTGLPLEPITDMVARISQVITSRSQPSKGSSSRLPTLGLYTQVVIVLVLLRQNKTPSMAADLMDLKGSEHLTLLPPTGADHRRGTGPPRNRGAGRMGRESNGAGGQNRRAAPVLPAGITENHSGKKRSRPPVVKSVVA